MYQKASLLYSKKGCELSRKSKTIKKNKKRVLKLNSRRITFKLSHSPSKLNLDKYPNITTKSNDKYQSLYSIGRSNSKVEKAYDLEDNILVALKRHINLDAYECELKAYSHLNHPNIIKLNNHVTITPENSSAIFSPQNFALSLEYAAKKDLCSYWKKEHPINEDICRMIFKQILNAVHHMHEKEIAHMDLKLANTRMIKKRKEKC